MNRFCYLIIFCFCLVSCTSTPHPLGKPLPALSFDYLEPYLVHGGSVRIEQSFVPNRQNQILAGQMVEAPEKILMRYAQSRFNTEAGDHRLVFDLKNASLVKNSDHNNMADFFLGRAEDHYTLDLFIVMTPIRADGHRAAPFTIRLKRNLTFSQNVSVAEREFRQFEFFEKMITDIDTQVTHLVKHKMTADYF